MAHKAGMKNSPKPAGDAVGDAYPVSESYTDVGMTDRIPSPTTAADGYPQMKTEGRKHYGKYGAGYGGKSMKSGGKMKSGY